jgi:hypothetical protein
MAILRFPDHFPPTERWKRFFIGVRWLGPDLSFFKALKATQGERVLEELRQWGGGRRQEVASAVSKVLAKQLGWKSGVFLPEDAAAVAFHGPRFDFNDPEAALDAVVELLESRFGVRVPESFWQAHGSSTMGTLIDALLETSDA